MWRPEDWSNFYSREPDLVMGNPTFAEADAFEDGADAMLEALRRLPREDQIRLIMSWADKDDDAH